MVLGKLDIHLKKTEVGSYLTPYAEINPKWIEDLTIKQTPRKKYSRKAL